MTAAMMLIIPSTLLEKAEELITILIVGAMATRTESYVAEV